MNFTAASYVNVSRLYQNRNLATFAKASYYHVLMRIQIYKKNTIVKYALQ